MSESDLRYRLLDWLGRKRDRRAKLTELLAGFPRERLLAVALTALDADGHIQWTSYEPNNPTPLNASYWGSRTGPQWIGMGELVALVERGEDSEQPLFLRLTAKGEGEGAKRRLGSKTTGKQPAAKRNRRRPCARKLTPKQQEAWTSFQRHRCFTAVADELGISRQAATGRVERANETLKREAGRSVQARQRIRTDRRGQENVSMD